MSRRYRRWVTAVGLVALLGATGVRCAVPAFPLPDLLASAAVPVDGTPVSRSSWFVLDFASPVAAGSESHVVAGCNEHWKPISVHFLDSDSLVVRPRGDWPAGASCQLVVSTGGGLVPVSFETAAVGTPFSAPYDRRDPEEVLPFPDDFYLVSDASTATGLRPSLALPTPAGDFGTLLGNVAAVVQAESDGWSPIGNLSVHLSARADEASLPMERPASLDPLSTVALIDLTPGSPSFGERVPFQLVRRANRFGDEPMSHNLLLWPGIPLEPEGKYGLVITDRVLDRNGEPLARSEFFQAVVAPPVAGEAPEIAGARPLAQEVLAAAENLSPVPIPRGDVVLAVRLSIRSTDHFSDDVLAMRDEVLATPPNVVISSVTSDAADPDVAAVVEGTFVAPTWLDANAFVQRGADGLPESTGTAPIPFCLSLPAVAAASGSVPIVMYQHGRPGTAIGDIQNWIEPLLAPEGFAVAGIDDVVARRFVQATWYGTILNYLLTYGRPPDEAIVTYADQLAFLQALQSLGSLDVLPVGAPDGVPDLDADAILYEGNSMGASHGQAFLAYAPDVLAGALIVGGSREAEVLEYQDRTNPQNLPQPTLRKQLPALISGVRAPDLWMMLSLWAMAYDPQDPHNHARFLFREPVEVDGTNRKPSVLVVEGIEDTFVPNNATDSLAWQLGAIPQLAPALVRVDGLPEQTGPIQGNVDAETTAALVQYAPVGASVPPSPGCVTINESEGHLCAQDAPEAQDQLIRYLESALIGVPVID